MRDSKSLLLNWCVFEFLPPKTISALQQKGIALDKQIQNQEKQLYFLTVFISKWFQFFFSSFPKLTIALLMATDLSGGEEMIHFKWTSKDTNTAQRKMGEGDRLSVNDCAKAKCSGISQILPFLSLTG